MNIRMSPCWLPVLALAGLLSCSSDDYSTVGGTLPLDVSQDSLEVELAPVYATAAEAIVPQDTLAVEDRGILYLGNRSLGGWRGTPLLRFDFTDSIPEDRQPFDWGTVTDVRLLILGMTQPEDVAVIRQVRAYSLLTPLTAAAADVPSFTDLLGDEIGSNDSWFKGGTASISLPVDSVRTWIEAGRHNGIAIVDETPEDASLFSNFSGWVGKKFVGPGRTYEVDPKGPPKLAVELTSATDNFRFPVDIDLTHMERDLPDPGDLEIGAWIERRVWLDFDLGADLVPTDATINSGTLVLTVKPEFSMQVRGFSTGDIIRNQAIQAWEATREEAGDMGPDVHGEGGRAVASSETSFNPDPGAPDTDSPAELRINVREYVQRQVSEIIPDDLPAGTDVSTVGLLLAYLKEDNDLSMGVFYGISAADSLRPRLEITYTPPADTWR